MVLLLSYISLLIGIWSAEYISRLALLANWRAMLRDQTKLINTFYKFCFMVKFIGTFFCGLIDPKNFSV